MFSFWQLISIFSSRTCIFLKKLWGIWEIANLIRNKASVLPAPSAKRKEKKPSDTLRGSGSLAGRWEQNKWLQGDLTLGRSWFIPWVTRVYIPFRKHFALLFKLPPSFLLTLCRCPFPCESCSEHEGSIPFLLPFPACPWPRELQRLGVPCHRTLFCPILYGSL